MRSTGSWYDVWTEDHKIVQARLRGKMRQEGSHGTNPVAVGDHVHITQVDDEFMIEEILPRSNYIVRKVDRGRRNKHVLAANLDLAILVITPQQPKTPLGFIDRFLVTAERFDIPVLIVVNKADLLEDDLSDDWKWIAHNYENLGYTVLFTSVTQKSGLTALIDQLKSKTTLIAGQSGVGKSSLLNALDPDLDLKTGEVSHYNEKGQHTTTYAQMFRLRGDIQLIDSPGIRSFALFDFDPADISIGFREIHALSQGCKFNNCTHQNEPNCAIREAADAGEIASWRWENYNHILNDIAS